MSSIYTALTLTNNTVLAEFVIISLIVRNNQIPILVVSVRLVFGDADAVEPVRGLEEDGVHFFERTQTRFWEEEVREWEDRRIDHRKNDVCLVFDICKRHGGNHDHHEIEKPVGGSG